MEQKPTRLQLWSACLGNLFEHYDTALFGFLATFLAPLIFPDYEPLTALILTYAMIPLGMLARPLGSIVFGYIGDRHGRQQALFLSLVGMSIVSGCIALSPTYAQAGVIAPLLFCLGRLLQNFFASGEVMGGAIFLLENTPQKHHDLLSGLYSASTVAGILAASAGVTLLSTYQIVDGGWRLLYLLGCITAIFGCLIRRKLPMKIEPKHTHKFRETISSYCKTFWIQRKALLLVAVTAGFSYANYSVALILMNGFIPLVSSLTKEQMIQLNTLLLALDFCLLPLFGWLSSKISREKMMIAASVAVVVGAIPLFILLKGATLFTVVAVRICLVIFGVAFCAPLHAWSQQLIPANHRYTIITFGYALGSQLLGGPTAAISLWLFKSTGMVSSVTWYWVALAVISSLIVAKTFVPKVLKEARE